MSEGAAATRGGRSFPRLAALLVVLLAVLSSACSLARLAVYSRPGGAEVFVNDRFIARTVNEVTPVRVDVHPETTYIVRVVREDYEPWERVVRPEATRELAVLAELVPIPPPPPYVPTGTLEVRTEPGSARLRLNGEELGWTKEEAYEPVRVEGLEPGSYLLRVDREGFQVAEERFLVSANMVTRATIRLYPLKPYYLFASNDDLVRQAVMRAVRGAAHLPGMRASKTIALVNLDGPSAPGVELRPLIEDALVAELAQNGRAVAEREDHLLVRIANEAARGETLLFDILTRHAGPDRPFIYDARLRTGADVAVVSGPGAAREQRILVRDLATEPPSRIPSADQVLGYRIVERTLRVDPVHEPGQIEPMLRREAVVRLFLRLLDARTGVVQWAERYEAAVEDEVPERVYRHLERPPNRFYGYAPGSDRGSPSAPPDTRAAEPFDAFTPANLPHLGDAEATFWYCRNIGEAYLRAGRFEEAERLLRQAVELRPRDYESRMFLGQALLAQNRIEEAGAEYLAALAAIGSTP